MVSKEKINEFIRRAYKTACEHGFHDEERSDAHWMMLVISEIGEMVEADRKNRHTIYSAVAYCDVYKEELNEKSWATYFERDVKDTLEDELADVLIRMFDFCGTMGVEPLMTDNGIVDMSDAFERLYGNSTLTEQCFCLADLVTDVADSKDLPRDTGVVMAFCFEFARHHKIDIEWHIEHKMAYNESRPNKHGKGY